MRLVKYKKWECPLENIPTFAILDNMEDAMLKMLRPDAKGRITLGALAEGVSGFSVTITDDHKIILEPYSEIPAREKWLFENKNALDSVNKGLEDAKAGRLKKRGSFSKYADEDK